MIEFRGAGPIEFGERLDTVIDIYSAAMRPPADQLPGRKAIMRNHGTSPFPVLFLEWRDAPLVPGDGEPRIVGFAYGFAARRASGGTTSSTWS